MTTTSCKTCGESSVNSLVNLYNNKVQKSILNQSKVGQSLYIQTKASLNNTINVNNEGKKHDTYQRYLMKKKGKVFSTQETKVASTPLYGNKVKSLNLSSLAKSSCDFC